MRNLEKSLWPIRTNISPVYKVSISQIARSLNDAVEVLFPVLYFSLENCKHPLCETEPNCLELWFNQCVHSMWISMCKSLCSAYFELLCQTLLSPNHRFSPTSSSSLPRPKDMNNFLSMEWKELTKPDLSKLLVWN